MSLVVVERDEWVWYGDDVVRGIAAVADRAKGKRIVVALASELCFAGAITGGGSPQEKLYRLEEVLPIAAEEVIAGFVGNADTSFGVAVERETLRSVLEKLGGAEVVAVCPLALLAVGAVTEGTLRMAQDVVKVLAGKPVEWTWGVGPATGAKSPAEQVVDARAFAQRILEGKARPPIDLRQAQGGALKSRTGMLAVAAAVMLAAGIGSMWVRSSRYDSVAGQLVRAEQDAFGMAAPGKEVPMDVVGRLESEARKLEGTGSVDLPGRRPMSAVMVEVLGCLPANLKLEVTELRVEGETLSLAGRVASHRDAEAIAGALRSGSGFEVGSPGTEQLADGTVSFSISGTRKSVPKAGGAQ